MSENEARSIFPIQFDPVETFSNKTHRKTVNIGNTGGKYEWTEGSDYFEQHFAPDGSWDPAIDPEIQRKHSTLYPAVLWDFLRWQDNLEQDDPRKAISQVKGATNETMSNFRVKLLGAAYTFIMENNEQNPTNHPRYAYTINLDQLRNDAPTMHRLEKYATRARNMNYTTTTTMPKTGEIPFFSIKADELSKSTGLPLEW